MASPPPLPLAVDLDGTLIRSDTLYESVVELIKRHPLDALRLPLWLAGGKAHLKAQIAARAIPAADALPYRTEFVDWVRAQSQVRPVVLVTATDRRIADAVAAHVGCFTGVMATEQGVNLKAGNKARALVERYGERGFDYAGNDTPDLAVWQHANAAVVVGASSAVAQAARAGGNVAHEFEPAAGALGTLKAWAKALRLYQWVKNLLIFVAPAAAHVLLQPAMLRQTLLAFLAFGMAASAVYLINDLLDLPSDRRHARKRRRPFAAGTLPIAAGLVAAPLLLVASVALGLLVGLKFTAVLLFYIVLTTLYSVWLKKKVFLDAAVLAGLYTLRVVAGAAATSIVLSFWLLAVSAYGFLGLALLKRYSELRAMEAEGKVAAAGRGYRLGDMPIVMALGVGASMLATLVMALYIDSTAGRALYSRPEALWVLVGLMMLGVGRLWIKAGRGEMHDDPIVYVARDPWSLALLALGGLAVIVAIK